jgi:hypothetical protein
MGSDSESLIFAKSLALIQKTHNRVAQVDATEFPTPSSQRAKTLLLNTLDALGDKRFWAPMNSEALYSTLIHIQSLVDQVENSNSDHISWPIVSCCDHIWKQFFPTGEADIFYSVMTEHNYGVGSFSGSLRRLIEKVLPSSQIKLILNDRKLYCLQLPSLEDENLPLYANIGHEFGHAIFKFNRDALGKLLAKECDLAYRSITNTLKEQDSELADKRKVKAASVIKGIATELFCDMIGFLISGPAFLLSLHEMTWGVDEGTWSALLSPTLARIRAYPSFRFRLHCLHKVNRIARFEIGAQNKFKALETKSLSEMHSFVSSIPIDHSHDRVEVLALSDPDDDRKSIEAALLQHFSQLKAALENFITSCWEDFLSVETKSKHFPDVSPEAVFELLRRLENDILPNIVPDGTLLGIPASFAEILNASAIYRVHLLSRNEAAKDPDDIYREIQKLERLTAKALEVSYMQGEFKAWVVKEKQ